MCRLLFLLLAFAPLATSSAKDQRICRIVFLDATDDLPEKLYLFDGKKSYKVEPSHLNLSSVYKLNPGALTLQLTEKKLSKSKPAPEGTPQATVAESVLDLLLVVGSDPENKTLPLKLDVIDADPSKFTKGNMLWSNMTDKSIEGNLGDEELSVEAGARMIVKAPVSSKSAYPVKISFRIPNDERLRPLCETTWQHDPSIRTYQLVIDQANSRVPRIISLPDFR